MKEYNIIYQIIKKENYENKVKENNLTLFSKNVKAST